MAKRLLALVPVLLGISLLTFWIFDVMPGNAAESLLGPDATTEQIAQLEARLGLDRPAGERYLEWAGRLIRGDLGYSVASKQPVAQLIGERLFVTVQLVALAFVLAIGLAVSFALLAAYRPSGLIDRIAGAVSSVSLSMPSYLLALLLVLVFAVNFGAFPSIGYTPINESLAGNLSSLTLPAIALACPMFGLYARFLRGDLLEQLEGQGYIVAARAKGLGAWQVLLRHALRNSLFGLITVVALNIGTLLGGTVIVEQIFGLPGIGQLLLQSVNTRDVVVVQAIVLLMAVTTVVATLCADLLYSALDPRVTYETS